MTDHKTKMQNIWALLNCSGYCLQFYFLFFCTPVLVPCFPKLLVHAASLTALFKHIASVDEPSTDEFIREKVLSFIRDKVWTWLMVIAMVIMSIFLFFFLLSWRLSKCICRYFLLKLSSWSLRRKWKGTLLIW